MIYTCTLNPAIDLFIETETMRPNQVNRTNFSDILANGKGINVSFILKKLNIESFALGIGGGFTNEFIERALEEKGISYEFIHTAEPTRINVFTQVKEENKEYKLVNKGPKVTKDQVNELLDFVKRLTSSDIFIISGSFARGINHEVLTRIARLSSEQKFSLIIDVSYLEARKALEYRPLLIKPNEDELMEWFGLKEKLNLQGYYKYLTRLLREGAQNILFSLGSKGAIYLNDEKCLYGNAPQGKVVNTACSGDTMLAVFIAGFIQGKDDKENLKASIAAGSSTAFTSGLTDFHDCAQLSRQIKITTLERE